MRTRSPALHRARVVATLLALTVAALTAPRRLIAQTPAAPSHQAAPAPAHVDTMVVTVADGTKLHYIERGSGPAVVIVHGTNGELGDWEPHIAALSSHHRVIAYSRRFHRPNAAPTPTTHYVMDQQAEDLAALIRRLHAAPAHIVAHSYGAYIALRMAVLHPELVRSLVLAEPPVLGWLGGTPEADSVRAAFQANALEPSRAAFARGDSVGGVRHWYDGVVGRVGAFDAMPEPARRERLAFAGELRAEMLTPAEEYMAPLRCEQVRALRKPVLLTRGEKSARMFHLVNARLQPCFASVDTLTVPGTSHGSQVYAPTFINRVMSFLSVH